MIAARVAYIEREKWREYLIFVELFSAISIYKICLKFK